PSYRNEDRRFFTTVARAEMLAGMRALFDMDERAGAVELVATRGGRLVLFRVRFSGHDWSVGPLEAEFLDLIESDGEGRRLFQVTFNPGELDAAYDELDARFVAGEGAPFAEQFAGNRPFRDAYARRDWDAAAELIAPGAHFEDHRPMGWGTLDRDGYLATLSTLPEVAADARLRMPHLV